jgi:hypothetical protein
MVFRQGRPGSTFKLHPYKITFQWKYKKIMKAKSLSVVAALTVGGGLLMAIADSRAITSVPAPTMTPPSAVPFETIRFSDSAEAGVLLRAFYILQTGDHDYDGHRVKALHEVEAAAKLLEVHLRVGGKDHQRQYLSDDKIREAQDLLAKVRDDAEVKAQPDISKHISEAMHEIDLGLAHR